MNGHQEAESDTGARVSSLTDLPESVKWLVVTAGVFTCIGIFGIPFVPLVIWGPFYYWPALVVAVPIFVAAWRLIPSDVPPTD